MKTYKISGYGLAGVIDLGVIRHITTLQPLVDFIDRLLVFPEATVDVTALSFNDTNYEEIGYTAFKDVVNSEYVAACYEKLSGDEMGDLHSALAKIADEFRQFKWCAALEDPDNRNFIGGEDLHDIYANIYAMYKAIQDRDGYETADVISMFVLSYVYKILGETIVNVFAETVLTFERTLFNEISSIEIEIVNPPHLQAHDLPAEFIMTIQSEDKQ